MKEVLTVSSGGCVALAPCGKLHLCSGPLHFVFTREQMIYFIDFLQKVKVEMETIHGYNKVFFETGLAQLRVALCEHEVESLIDLMNEAELAMSIKEIL